MLILAACNEQHSASKAPAARNMPAKAAVLRQRLSEYAGSKNADIGIAVMDLQDGDTVTVNGGKYYRLMSVAKFPQALLLLHLVEEGRIKKDAPIYFGAEDLRQATGSSLRTDHPGAAFDLSLPEALRYSIGQSDNITSNKFFKMEGGPAAVSSYVHSKGVSNMRIVADYAHMGDDSLHSNKATPLAVLQLLQQFYRKALLADSTQNLLWATMVKSTSGPDRLKGALPPGTVVAHKTGTSGTDSTTGITAATNDAGIVQLPDGRCYAIAVFVGDSRERGTDNAAMIARISKTAWDYFIAKGK